MFLVALPEMMNPAIRTLLPVSTRIRVAIFSACGVAGVGVGVAVGVGVGLGVAVAVAVGVGVVDGPGVGVGVGDEESWKVTLN